MAITGNKTYFEYRGVSNAVYAEVLQDDASGFVTGPVKNFTGVSEIAKTTDSANEPHYYDNIPAIIVSSTGSDGIAINSSGIPFDTLAEITGQYYDSATGMFVEQERTPKYFAFGYITQKTDGTEVLVWRLKGSFSIPGVTSQTQNDGTDANGQELTYTGISTTYKFTKNGAPAKAVNIDTSVNASMTTDAFFDSVMTPDTVGGTVDVTGVGVAPATLALTVGESATLTATVVPFNATDKSVTWESASDAVASVVNGVVTGEGAGTTTITVTTTDGSFTDTCAVTVTAPTE